MKIEIELEAVERLRKENENLKGQVQELLRKLDSLDEDNLKQQALSLSNDVFICVMGKVYESLGMKPNIFRLDVDFTKLQHRLGYDWYKSERLDINVGAIVTNQFRSAFLSMGIKPKEDE